MGARNKPMSGVPTGKLNEPRIYDGVDGEKLKANWGEIQDNSRLIGAYCGKYGIDWYDLSYQEKYEVRDEIIEKAKNEGL